MHADRPAIYRPRRPRASPLWQCVHRHLSELRATGRVRRAVERSVLERFLECGDPHRGVARIRCAGCGHDLLLGERLRREVLRLFVRKQVILPPLAARMLGWRHSGFTVHNQVRVAAGDSEGRKSLAAYMLRAPFSLEKTSYDPASGSVIYRSRLHATLRRNFQAMPGADWLELLCKHIPDRNEHTVRYYGRYSSRARGAESERPGLDELEPEIPTSARQAAKAVWAKLIRKVYEVDPLECPKCGAEMRVIALIEDPAVIQRILSWLGLWVPPRPGGPSPPEARAGPPLTYHAVPDIA